MIHRLSVFLLLLQSFLFINSVPDVQAGQDRSAARRAEILETARKYTSHEWRATGKNMFHGMDANGVRVDTPDSSYIKDGWDPGGRVNVGIPYQWGGFSSLEDFEKGVKAGKYAGHLPVKGALGASANAVGVDCSGFVSRCWDLPLKQSTRSLGRLCYELERYDDLLPGDILNTHDGHVLLFEKFVDSKRSRVRVYEAAFPCVKAGEYDVARLKKSGYLALRYKPLDPRWQVVEIGDPTFTVRKASASGRWIADSTPETGETAGDMGNPLAQAEPGEWARYRFTSGGSGRGRVTAFTVVKAAPDSVDIQSLTEINGKRLETIEAHDPSAPVIQAMIDFIVAGEKIREIKVLESRFAQGTYLLGGRKFRAAKVKATVSGVLVIRRIRIPIELRLNAVLSSEAPLLGLLHVDYMRGLRRDGLRHKRIGTVELIEFRSQNKH